MNGLRGHITGPEPNLLTTAWTSEEDMLLETLEMYVQKDVWTLVASDTTFPSCKSKWEKLKEIYSGVGQMSTFNTWASLTRTALEKS